LTKEGLSSFHTKADLAYLTGMEMSKLQEQLGNLPEHSIVLYTSLFEDAEGNKFVNATQALPMVAAAANAPVFGMSDTYMGHGIIGGDVLGFENQGKVTARIVSELLDGREPGDLLIETLPSVYMFDWKVMQRWHVRDSSLPSGSVVLFREPGLWGRTKWAWAMAFLIILALSGLAAYLQHSRKQLQFAKEGQRRLSGMLINAEEQERSRLASELHDDFSQRLAVVALGLENVEEAVPVAFQEAHQQLRELVNSTSEIGADLHTLSHRLHSSTLESLGLVPAVTALCKEFKTKQGVNIEFVAEGVPRLVHPDAALCVFRIVQEGLRNLQKHSGAGKALVDLRRTGNRLDVTVRDEGRGFALKELRQKEGLGIRSMTERARLLGGKFEIHSEPGKGTIIKASVPLKPDSGQVTS
jgi:signal transduction histidine kinase